VSACLLGVRCRYDGESREVPGLAERLTREDPGAEIVPVCPEELGGLPTPRSPSIIRCGGCSNGEGDATGPAVLAGRARVLSAEGLDRTAEFVRGAREAVRIARASGAAKAVLKTRSPSCDPAFGVAAAALGAEGLTLEAAG
jgi:uncharacterized protein YbbK (DUF523 family)